jgi:hypothetical protein
MERPVFAHQWPPATTQLRRRRLLRRTCPARTSEHPEHDRRGIGSQIARCRKARPSFHDAIVKGRIGPRPDAAPRPGAAQVQAIMRLEFAARRQPAKVKSSTKRALLPSFYASAASSRWQLWLAGLAPCAAATYRPEHYFPGRLRGGRLADAVAFRGQSSTPGYRQSVVENRRCRRQSRGEVGHGGAAPAATSRRPLGWHAGPHKGCFRSTIAPCDWEFSRRSRHPSENQQDHERQATSPAAPALERVPIVRYSRGRESASRACPFTGGAPAVTSAIGTCRAIDADTRRCAPSQGAPSGIGLASHRRRCL